jgi:hypothetical protein
MHGLQNIKLSRILFFQYLLSYQPKNNRTKGRHFREAHVTTLGPSSFLQYEIFWCSIALILHNCDGNSAYANWSPNVVEGSEFFILRAPDQPVNIFIKYNLFLYMHYCELTIFYILVRPNDDILKANTCSFWYYVKLYIFWWPRVFLFLILTQRDEPHVLLEEKKFIGMGYWFEPRGLPSRRLKAFCGQLPYLTHQAELTLVSLPFTT